MTWLAQRPVERVSSWSSELELESGIVDFLSEILSQRRRGAEYAEVFWAACGSSQGLGVRSQGPGVRGLGVGV